MEIRDRQTLGQAHCRPCEGGVEPWDEASAQRQLERLPGWKLTHGGQRIRKDLQFANFRRAMSFLQACGEIAEAEAHHPDLHLTGYRNVRIEVFTHAIGGLSENDFILAAKIDALPIGD
ncbi:MAG TPA: pterin-4-alpha-carbinolamine dehydratase [Planctomycetaceae bacterium]|nr:pterin-4-alpha-carbinolamine dehydratase [Planctomycetaceae bacterium]HRF00327.1 4a-hydroxytetrahydrobiopterin dehydratase [Pirellulaceae bacterium]